MEYPKEVEEKINYYQDKIKEVKTTVEDVVLVKKLFPNMEIWVDSNKIHCYTLVKSMTEVKSMLKIFAEAGVLIEHFKESDYNPVWHLKGKNATILLDPIWPDEEVEGAICKVIKVGEETISCPKYKLVCSDGSNSDLKSNERRDYQKYSVE